MSADQLYNRGVQLIRRMVAPQKLAPEAEFNLLKPWVWSVVPKQARVVMDARTVTKAEDLIGALQDYLVMEGERKEGQAAVFGRTNFSGEGSREWTTVTCFKCGKQGHKSFECGAEEIGVSLPPASVGSSFESSFGSSNQRGVTCFSCGMEGHKSPQCPNKNVRVQAEPKEIPRQVKRLKGHPNRDTFLKMVVNGQKVPVLLDSGSAITVVPSVMVAQAQLTGETVELRGFAAREAMVLPLAEIPFAVDGSCWNEVVALAPPGAEVEVVYGLDLLSTRGLQLVYLANKLKLKKEAASEEEVKEEVKEEEVGLEEEEEEEEEKVYRLRRLDILSYGGQLSGMVGGSPSRLEASLQPSVVSYDFCNYDCSDPGDGEIDKELLGESSFQKKVLVPMEEPRAALVSVGGDVGITHRRREREKEKEEDGEQRTLTCEPVTRY